MFFVAGGLQFSSVITHELKHDIEDTKTVYKNTWVLTSTDIEKFLRLWLNLRALRVQIDEDCLNACEV